VSCNLIGELFGLNGDLLERQYRDHLSGYRSWDQREHAQDWILFPKNMGSYIGIDEVALSRGELYTVVINKEAKGKRGSIIAIIRGTDAKSVSKVLLQMTRKRRFQAREITLDMAPNMELIAKTCFPAAKRVIDRFHVQQLAFDAVQEMRIKARWQALDRETIDMHTAKTKGEKYIAPVFKNGDSLKQLLARSRYLLFKKESLWTESQRQRADILFSEYPHIKKAYYLSMQLGLIYHQCRFKDVALTRLAKWYDQVDKSGFLAFGTIARTIQSHYLNIMNFFERRSTNAAIESFNAKIKAFRRVFRGVKDKAFFLFRLSNLYA
jgi:transposase